MQLSWIFRVVFSGGLLGELVLNTSSLGWVNDVGRLERKDYQLAGEEQLSSTNMGGQISW